MEKYLEVLKKVPLFQGVSESDITSLLNCLNGIFLQYNKNTIIMPAGKPVVGVGIVCQGDAQVVRDDITGNRTILASLHEGDIFAEALACARVESMPVSVLARSKCVILKIDYQRIITTCPSSCMFHNKMIENMLGILAHKNLGLNQKNEILSARSTREKLNIFLLAQAKKTNKRQFQIPFNRQELADYISVERSALSRELGHMQKEGLIKFHKNSFEILF